MELKMVKVPRPTVYERSTKTNPMVQHFNCHNCPHRLAAICPIMPIKLMTTTENGCQTPRSASLRHHVQHLSRLQLKFYHCSKASYNIPSYGGTVESTFAIWYPNAHDLRIRMKDMN